MPQETTVKHIFILFALIACPTIAFGADFDVEGWSKRIANAQMLSDAKDLLEQAHTEIEKSDKYKNVSLETKKSMSEKMNSAKQETQTVNKNTNTDGNNSNKTGNNDTKKPTISKEELAKKEKNVQDLKEKEQSLANRTLGAVSMAATGIGGMELAQGLSEQRIDRESEQDMAAYIETFRCEYANGKSVKNGATNVELPADTLFDLYQEYIALAADVKAMKEQLDLAPGIESEVIIDKATAGLYDDKASEKANGTYASIYRAKMGNETDQSKLQEMSDTSGKRVKGGAIAAGAGALVGIVGDALINHVDWDKIKEKKNTSKENKDKIKTLKKGLAGAGLQNVDALDLSNFDFSSFDIDSIDFTKLSSKLKGKDAKELINTANKTSLLSSFSNLGLSFNN